MLKKLHLENFKSWKTLDLELSNLTLLFGTNSSGKTSILSSLLLLKQTATGSANFQPINLGGGESDYVDFGSYKNLIFGHDEKLNLGIRIEWNPTTSSFVAPSLAKEGSLVRLDELAYSIGWQQRSDRIVIDSLGYEVLEPKKPERFLETKWYSEDREGNDIYDTTFDEVSFNQELDYPSGAFYTAPLTSYSIPHGGLLGSLFNKLFEEMIMPLAYLGPLRSYPARNYLWKGTVPQPIGPRGEGAIEALLASDRQSSRKRKSTNGYSSNLLSEVAEWLAILGLAGSFQTKALDLEKRFYEVLVKVRSEQPENALIDVGFGVSQVLPVIVLLFSVPTGSLVLLEQPEIHLHPSAQAGLADLFLYAAEKRNLQLIVESHSEYLLRRLQRRIAEQERRLATPEHIKMYFCESGPDGSTIDTVNVDRFGQISNWPDKFFGDVSGDLEKMTRAGLQRRREELINK